MCYASINVCVMHLHQVSNHETLMVSWLNYHHVVLIFYLPDFYVVGKNIIILIPIFKVLV